MRGVERPSERRARPTRRTILRRIAAVSAGIGVSGGIGRNATVFDSGTARAQEGSPYDLETAREVSYWYARYNCESVLLSEAGVRYPQEWGSSALFEETLEWPLEETELERHPIRGIRSVTIAPSTVADPAYGTTPTFSPQPVQGTLLWEGIAQPQLTPQDSAWFVQATLHLSRRFDTVGDPEVEDGGNATATGTALAALYGVAAWWGLEYAFTDEAVLRDTEREDDDHLYLVNSYDTETGETELGEDHGDPPLAYAATLWCLSSALAFAEARVAETETTNAASDAVERVQTLADATARTIVEEFDAPTIVGWGGIRDVGTMLAATGSYGPVSGDEDTLEEVEAFAIDLVEAISREVDDGRVDVDTDANQAATQGALAQGLVVVDAGLEFDVTGIEGVLTSFLEDSWDEDHGTFDDERTTESIVHSARDAGDIVGGFTAALDVFEEGDDGFDVLEDVAPAFFDATINYSRLQRAQRNPTSGIEAAYWLPFPSDVGGFYGEAPVFTGAVTYDREADVWSVIDRAFRPAEALYAATQFGWFDSLEGDQ